MNASKELKKILYEHYVSSGQAAVTGSAENAFAGRRHYVKHIIEKYIPENKSCKIGDLGCGAGIYLYFLKKYGYQNIEGIDISNEQISAAQQLGITEAKQADLFDYLQNKQDGHFGALLLIDILEHFKIDEGYRILDAVYNKLKPGGRCILHVPNAGGIFGTRVLYGDLTHELAFTESSVRQLLNTIGFSRIEVYEDKPIIHGLTSFCRNILWHLLTVPHRLLLASESGVLGRPLSQNILVVAHK